MSKRYNYIPGVVLGTIHVLFESLILNLMVNDLCNQSQFSKVMNGYRLVETTVAQCFASV